MTASTAPAATSTTSQELAEQVDALHQIADILGQAGLAGLMVIAYGDGNFSIQIAAELGTAQARTAMVGHLAAVMGTSARRRGGTGPTADSIIAEARIARHHVHIYTPIESDTP